MKKRYIQRERAACFVSFTREIMASTENEAQELFDNGEGDLVSTEIGDMLSMGVVESTIDQEDR